MDERKGLVRWIIFLSAAIAVSVTFMLQVPGAELRYGPLILFLFVIPIGIAAWSYRSYIALCVAIVSLTAAAIVFCIPQHVYVRSNDKVDIDAVIKLQDTLEVPEGGSISLTLANFLNQGGTLSELLDQGVSYTLLSHLWPESYDFKQDYRAHLVRPLFTTGVFWQILLMIVAAPFLSVLAEGGMGTRKRLAKVLEKNRYLEKRIEKELTDRTSGAKETAENVNRLQSMIITISDMAREISAALQDKTIYKLLLKKTVDLLKARKVALFKPDGQLQTLHMVGSIGYDPEVIRKLKIKMSDEGGILGWSAKNHLFLSMEEVTGDYHKADLIKTNKLETLFCQPVIRSGELILVICVGETEKPISHKAVARLMSTLANFAAISLDNARLLEQTRQQAIRDGLTGIYNHRYFQDYTERILKEAKEKGRSLSCILLDLDHFKRLNDTYGHQAGDEVLRRVSRILQEPVKGEDLLARYGGEEFVAVLVGKTSYESMQIAEKMRSKVEDTRIEAGNKVLNVTLSIGVSYHDPVEDEPIRKDVLIKHADKALYRAKEHGRNQVCFYGDGHKRRIA